MNVFACRLGMVALAMSAIIMMMTLPVLGKDTRCEQDLQDAASMGKWAWARPAEDHELVTFTLVLRYPESTKQLLQDTCNAVSDPTSDRYGQHLSFAEKAALTSNPEALQSVYFWLSSFGVTRDSVQTLSTGSLCVVWVYCWVVVLTLASGVLNVYVRRCGHRHRPG